jgi:non-ribosomal peptide synthase protein (TIGR01720 family)
VSWRVLLDDLHSAYVAHRAGRPVELPDEMSSFAEWTEHLARAVGQGALDGEIEFWRAQLAGDSALPLDLPAVDLSHPFGSVETRTSSLEAAATDSLLRHVIAETGASINDILITALLRTLAAWTGERSHLVAVEGHGRTTLDDAVDVARTVGWFTSLFPLRLELGSSGSLRDQLRRVGEQLRQVPRGGAGYGVLRYLHPDRATRASLTAGAPPPLTFNYLGQVDATLGGSFAAARESSGPQVAPATIRRHVLDVNAIVVGGRLTVDWHFSTLLHRRTTIDALASTYLDTLGAIIADGGGARARSEPVAPGGVDQREIDAAIRELDGAY